MTEKTPSSLFVRNLTFSTTSNDLTDFFSNAAPVKHAVVVTDKETGQSKGFGFVTFSLHEDAVRALEELKNKKLDGRILRMEFAAPRKRNGETSDKPKKPEQVRKDTRPRLIVRNLPWSVKKPKHLEPYFAKFGKVREIKVPTKGGGRMCGFAFVWMKDRASAQKAMDTLNATEIDGRVVAVDWAVSKDEFEQKKTEKGESNDSEESEDESEEESADEDESEEQEENESEVDEEVLVHNSDSGSDLEASEAEDSEKNLEKDKEDAEADESENSASEEEEDSGKPESTIFIRNLLFETTEQALYQHFRQFGPLEYAKIVKDYATGLSQGRGFVKFRYQNDYEACLELAQQLPEPEAKAAEKHHLPSVLASEEFLDPDNNIAKFTLDGRLLLITPAVTQDEASRINEEGKKKRQLLQGKGVDKRNLYLINEGRITANHPLYNMLSETDRTLRQESLRTRKKLLERNPTLHVSLTRLSIRNLSRHINVKILGMLGRQAVRGFLEEVKQGVRQPLTQEELERDENNGAGRSKGFGFLQYSAHKYALMALRWLNGREVTVHSIVEAEKEWAREHRMPLPELPIIDFPDKKRRLQVEFAIENIRIVKNRAQKVESLRKKAADAKQKEADASADLKRKRASELSEAERAEHEKRAKVARIIQQKRMKRRQRKH
ncbi:RNA-binding protein [Schizosaccharomyces japonicus yFS275]|uniref:RNA-binding protein n=1 Tax=Schizosaccharomyces japonicus (strain yFS275 / FY16936) TaxID=402676 RepID=B6K1A4_SCHJY|nr:RNA-binding protein [Schizosaccharomyces japonicus yFS275]EEB07725.2 RNA-binding protein [Schizosaccharomyces japonicus yFS275]